MRSLDTSPEMERMQLEILRNMPDGQRLRMVFEMCDFGRALSFSRIRQHHPEWDHRQIVMQYFREQFPEIVARML